MYRDIIKQSKDNFTNERETNVTAVISQLSKSGDVSYIVNNCFFIIIAHPNFYYICLYNLFFFYFISYVLHSYQLIHIVWSPSNFLANTQSNLRQYYNPLSGLYNK